MKWIKSWVTQWLRGCTITNRNESLWLNKWHTRKHNNGLRDYLDVIQLLPPRAFQCYQLLEQVWTWYIYQKSFWSLYLQYKYIKQALVFAVGRSRSVAVDFWRPTDRSILDRPAEKTTKNDRKSTFSEIFAIFPCN